MVCQFIIREYQQSDLASLMAVWECANTLAHPFLDKEYIAQIRQDIPALYIPNADTWVAEIQHSVVGFISLIGHEIGALFLLPDHHGVGIGAALVNKAEQLHGNIVVEVFKHNSIGRNFYRTYGFKILCESLHTPSGQVVLRMEYCADNSLHEVIDSSWV